ncbi:Anti-sigma-K factor rskA [Paramicrobacterium humi]|uniref:Anti-sigma-K factor rskA n=1 Tax=Paramicrobacterium humi TaxID=640635 RepID=A0A1H4NPP0_9MICO|nr:anti-sigma factor [Microbacterium humi]SEB96915.1 Anti-sigma-K factor rskA [Microbacterium humi]
MSNENQMSATAAAPTTKSGRAAPARSDDADWKQHKAERKAAKRGGKKWYAQPLAATLAAAAVAVSIVLASWFTGLIENGNQLPQALKLAQVNAQSDVLRSQVVLADGEDTATLVWSRKIDSAVLLVEGLPAIGSGDYRVWYAVGDEMVAAGTLHVDHSGSETWAVLEGDISAAGAVIVTADDADAAAPSAVPLVEISL